jgi:transglutaminase-like putative cysteine protease
MTYNLIHRTIYEYAAPVTVSHHAARVEPRVLPHQSVENCSLHIAPVPAVLRPRVDFFGNQVCGFSIQEIHRRLEVTATSRVTVFATTQPALSLSPDWEGVVKLFSDPVSPEVVEPYQFVFDSPLLRVSPKLAEYAKTSFTPGAPLLVAVADLNKRIFTDFKYDPVATTVATPLEEVLEKRAGVCQDFAHLAIASLRSLGLSARYVSGYLRTRPPEGKPRLIGADASHAWFSVYCPDVGWVDFDPTNNVLTSEDHITVAFGRDYSDVSPVSGVITGGGSHVVKVSVDVEALDGSELTK